MEFDQLYCEDAFQALSQISDNTIDLVVTSPPYFQQREYGSIGLGNETTLDEYIHNLLLIFKEAVRIIKNTGAVVINIGDKYQNGNLLLVPYRFAIEAQRLKNVRLINEITWIKTNPTPKQDPRKLVSATEPFFIFVKSNDYYFDKNAFLEYNDLYFNGKKKNTSADLGKKYFELIEKVDLTLDEKADARRALSEVIQEVKQGKIESFRMKIRGVHALPYGGQAGGRLTQIENKGFTIIKIYGNSMRKDVIESTVETIKGNIHPAVYPEFVVQEMIKLLTKEGDVVLDPFVGSGTTAVVAKRLKRRYIGIDLHAPYLALAQTRLDAVAQPFLELFI